MLRPYLAGLTGANPASPSGMPAPQASNHCRDQCLQLVRLAARAASLMPHTSVASRDATYERRVTMRKTKLTAYVVLICVAALAVAAFASASTSTISLRKTAVGKVLVGKSGR